MRKITRIFSFIAYLAVLSLPLNAAATMVTTTVIDFRTGLAEQRGMITDDMGEVYGSNIAIGAMEVHGSMYDGVYIAEATLSFDTSSNYIEIFGSVFGLHMLNGIATTSDIIDPCYMDPFCIDPGPGTPPAPLLHGYINDFSFTRDEHGNEIFSASGVDYKDPYLLHALGIDPNIQWGFFGFSIESANGYIISTDIVNTAVPVPAAVWLFGSGLLGLVGIARRKKTA